MTQSNQDIWSQWLLHRRYGGNHDKMKAMLDFLYPVRDRVLDNANLGEGEVLLDVGCGDGLIAFGALERFKTSKVIFSDISQDLLNHAQSLAEKMQLAQRCEFLLASAENLSQLQDASVDVVITRSVLIYVSAKRQALIEFYRVLKPQGRVSMFEPINAYPYPAHLLSNTLDGFDVTPVAEIAQKVSAVYQHLQPPQTDSMLDFDERGLIAFADMAGFKEIHLELEVDIKPTSDYDSNWEGFLRSSGNPKIPTLEEAMRQALTPTEMERFVGHLRPLVEAKKGVSRSAVAYLWAVKHRLG